MKSTMAVLCSLAFASAAGAQDSNGETRTVSGAFQTIYRPDDGTSTTLSTPPPLRQTVPALLVPDDSPSGYTAFPVTLESDYTFSVPGVPTGSYYLQLDTNTVRSYPEGPVPVVQTSLRQLTVDTPDLSVVSAARPDLARVTQNTPVTLNISNLQPWMSGDLFLISSSQADVYIRPVGFLFPPPTPGMTNYSGTFDWRNGSTSQNTAGLPDASKNDVVFFNQRSTLPIGEGPGAAELRYASRYARITDLTVMDGVPATLNASLVDTPLTGTMNGDVRGSQFAVLASDVNPTARPTEHDNLAISIQATPHTVAYPDSPSAASTSIFYFQSLTNTATDYDYGTLAYPQFHGPLWAEFRQLTYSYDVTLQVPGTKEPYELRNAAAAHYHDDISSVAADPVTPIVGPITVPLINGLDAFAPRSDAGLQPTFSWSPPTFGVPTSYSVWIFSISRPEPGDTVSLIAQVYNGTSFRVPPGFLKFGTLYVAVISAFEAPWDVLNRPQFRNGSPFHSMDCVTGIFTP